MFTPVAVKGFKQGHISPKTHFLHYRQEFGRNNVGVSDEQDECFQQDILVMEGRYQARVLG